MGLELWMIIPIFVFMDILFTYIIFSVSDMFIEINPIFFFLIKKLGTKGILLGGSILLPVICYVSILLPREIIIFLCGVYFIVLNIHYQNFWMVLTGCFKECPYMKENGVCGRHEEEKGDESK